MACAQLDAAPPGTWYCDDCARTHGRGGSPSPARSESLDGDDDQVEDEVSPPVDDMAQSSEAEQSDDPEQSDDAERSDDEQSDNASDSSSEAPRLGKRQRSTVHTGASLQIDSEDDD